MFRPGWKFTTTANGHNNNNFGKYWYVKLAIAFGVYCLAYLLTFVTPWLFHNFLTSSVKLTALTFERTVIRQTGNVHRSTHVHIWQQTLTSHLSLSSFHYTLLCCTDLFGFRSFLSPQIPSWLFSVIGEIPQRCVGYFINFASVWRLNCTHVHRFKWPRPRPKDPFVLLGMSWLAGASCPLRCTKLAPLAQKAELSGGGTFSLPVLTSSVAAPPSVG